MTEDNELQAKIAALSGKINQHKQHQHSPGANSGHPRSPYSPARSTRGHDPRWVPYGRGGRAAYPTTHKNRTLVLGGGQAPASSGLNNDHTAELSTTTQTVQTIAPETFVSTRGRGKNQLMNKDTYEREQKQKQEQLASLRSAKRQKAYHKDTTKLMSSLKASSPQNHRIITVDGISFQLREDGSKLLRLNSEAKLQERESTYNGMLKVPDGDANDKETPRRTKIAGVEFHRTKNGNLVRAQAVKHLSRYYRSSTNDIAGIDFSPHLSSPIQPKSRPQCTHFTKHGSHHPFQRLSPGSHRARISVQRSSTKRSTRPLRTSLTPFYLGNCPHGPGCKFQHDPSQVAICKAFLHKGECPSGEYCDLSHEPTYHRVSACTHFLRGNCTAGDSCRYPHVHVSPTAPVCKPFAALGYCPDGPNCPKRHVVECADYSNTGYCAARESGNCPLPHIDRAATMRKAAAVKQAQIVVEDDDSSIDGDEDDDDNDNTNNGDDTAAPADDSGMMDVDSDDADELIITARHRDDDHSMSQQDDFISLS